jgi:hypothetical protein
MDDGGRRGDPGGVEALLSRLPPQRTVTSLSVTMKRLAPGKARCGADGSLLKERGVDRSWC